MASDHFCVICFGVTQHVAPASVTFILYYIVNEFPSTHHAGLFGDAQAVALFGGHSIILRGWVGVRLAAAARSSTLNSGGVPLHGTFALYQVSAQAIVGDDIERLPIL